MSAPDLSALTKAQASSLALIAGSAIPAFLNIQHNAQAVLKQGGSERWLAEKRAELQRAKVWEAEARAFQSAAHRRAFEAEREECKVVRIIEAFAWALGDLCPRCRTYPMAAGVEVCRRCSEAAERAERTPVAA